MNSFTPSMPASMQSTYIPELQPLPAFGPTWAAMPHNRQYRHPSHQYGYGMPLQGAQYTMPMASIRHDDIEEYDDEERHMVPMPPMTMMPVPQQMMPMPQAQWQPPQLPDSYRMYTYGTRQIYWSNSVPVPEPNTGVMVNMETLGKKSMDGCEVVPCDLGVRNTGWRHQGPWVQPYDPLESAEWKAKTYGDYSQARDLVAPCNPGPYRKHRKAKDGDSYMQLHYSRLAEQRNQRGLFHEDHKKRPEEFQLFDDNELQAFLANPDAAFERL